MTDSFVTFVSILFMTKCCLLHVTVRMEFSTYVLVLSSSCEFESLIHVDSSFEFLKHEPWSTGILGCTEDPESCKFSDLVLGN